METTMTHQEILEEAIQKAIDGGWAEDAELKGVIAQVHPNDIIYDHQFAKALWGDSEDTYDAYSNRKYSMGSGGPDEDWYDGCLWEFHLQQMVIADDPIKYLGEHLNG